MNEILPTRRSWVESANDNRCDFPLQNLPYGVFQVAGSASIGVAIGDQILNLRACAEQSVFNGLSVDLTEACGAPVLNTLMELGPASWAQLRRAISTLLDHGSPRRPELLVSMARAEMLMPVRIGDYTDFYASIDHAARVGGIFRPENPLPPNYKYLPIGYHGRASSIVVSGTSVRRPRGQMRNQMGMPTFGLTQQLDFELEVGFFIGPGNKLGEPIPIMEAEQHIFGLCLLNDWSARDLQSWEYQPLGPFLGKSFATSISPWIVPLAALETFRSPTPRRAESDPDPLDYLSSASPDSDGLDVDLEAWIGDRLVTSCNLRDLYWTMRQMVTHHTSNGCNLRPGDLLATGTISGPDAGSEGCLLEKLVARGAVPRFLVDGETVRLRGHAERQGLPRIGLGECAGTVSTHELFTG